MKKFISFIFTFIVIFPILTPTASAARAKYKLPFEPDAQSYILVSLDTGEIIFEKDSHKQVNPSTLTKLLTAYTVMKYIDNPEETTVTVPRYIFDELYLQGGTHADIRQGEVLSVKDLLYAMLLPSGDEAASALADYTGKGSIDNFCMMMNNEAKKLGCTNTNFTNAHGLFNDNHYTSAYDMYLIAKACYETPGFMEIVTTNEYIMPVTEKHPRDKGVWRILTLNRMQKRTNKYYRSYIQGMHTGYTPQSGSSFVTICQKDGETYLWVVLGAGPAEDKSSAFETTAKVMDYFFENYSLRSANNPEKPLCEIRLKYAKDRDTLLLYSDEKIISVLPHSADETSFQKIYNLPESIPAPVQAGDVIGTVDYYLAGQKTDSGLLISRENVPRSLFMFIVSKIGETFSSLYFRVVLLVTLLFVLLYFSTLYAKHHKHEKINKIHRR